MTSIDIGKLNRTVAYALTDIRIDAIRQALVEDMIATPEPLSKKAFVVFIFDIRRWREKERLSAFEAITRPSYLVKTPRFLLAVYTAAQYLVEARDRALKDGCQNGWQDPAYGVERAITALANECGSEAPGPNADYHWVLEVPGSDRLGIAICAEYARWPYMKEWKRGDRS